MVVRRIVYGAVALAISLHTVDSQAQSEGSGRGVAREVSLSELLRWAERGSPVLALARARISRGRAEIIAAAPLFPSDPLLSGSVARRANGVGSGIDYEIGLEQELEIFGERAARRRAADATMDLARASVQQARWSVHREIHDAFHSALVARARVSAAERFVTFAERFLAVARRRFGSGEISSLPVELAESDLAEARQARIAAKQSEERSLLSLKLATGWPANRPLAPAGGLGVPSRAPPVAHLVALAERRDPGLRTRMAALRRARARLAAAQREPWPNPRVGVAYSHESEPGGSAATIWRGTLSVPIPIWQANRPARARAQAEVDVALAELSARRRTLDARVRRAASAVNANSARVRLYTAKILPKLEKSLSLVQTAFELGEIDATQVLVARERFLRSQATALNAYDDYFRARGALEEAVGTELEDERASHRRSLVAAP